MTSFKEFSPEHWEQAEHTWRRWWTGELERPLVVLESVDQTRPGYQEQFDHLTKYPLDFPIDTLFERANASLEATSYYGDAYPRWWVNFGPGVVAAFLGSQVHYETETTWFAPLPVDSLAEIRLEYQAENPWWLRVQQITRQALQLWVSKVAVGFTDLGGNLDILASLRGSQKLLVDLLDNPEQVQRLSSEITQLWLRYYNELAKIILPAGRGSTAWAPVLNLGRGYMMQSDFSYMISPRMFKRFVLPDLECCTQAMDFGFYHMDGVGQIPHLDLLLSLPRLRGIQWVPGDGHPGAEHWPDLLRRIRQGGKLCQITVSPDEALRMRSELGCQGFIFYILAKDMREEEAGRLSALLA